MLPERLRDAGLSAWKLGDLLGIHPDLVSAPHLVSGPHPLLLDRAMQVLIRMTPHTGTVLTAVRMDLVHDPARWSGPADFDLGATDIW